jgi:hypothetical protein
MSDEEFEMEAEPAVYYNGDLMSDESEHAEWLNSPEGNRLADAMAMEGIEDILTPEQIISLYGDLGRAKLADLASGKSRQR